jgi:hypothetical protein
VQDNNKPTAHPSNFSKLPKALSALIERERWAVWKWTRTEKGVWQKPPYQGKDPRRHASTTDPATWCSYSEALSTVLAGQADGITYMLGADDQLAAIDVDHCRDPKTGSIHSWAQNILDAARDSYAEITPSGEGLRIWGLAGADAESVNRKFSFGSGEAVEVFRRTAKALTITGARIAGAGKLTDTDKLIGWALTWAERKKAASEAAKPTNGHAVLKDPGFGGGYDVEFINQVIREGAPDGANRSDLFHAIVGHLIGTGLDAAAIEKKLRQRPDGIAARYIAEDRLDREIARSAAKYESNALPVFAGFAPIASTPASTPKPKPKDPDDDLEEPPEASESDGAPGGVDSLAGVELGSVFDASGAPVRDPRLPQMYAHGEDGQQPLKSWAIKGLMPTTGHGLLSGQWGAFKTFVALELASALITGTPFVGHRVKRQCGVMFVAAEGAGEVRLRLNAVVEHKCSGVKRAPFLWFDKTPALLQQGAAEKLSAMARQTHHFLTHEFGLPLGLIVVDTISNAAGYMKGGDDNDSATTTALMGTLRAVAETIGCFVLGVDHFGKDIAGGTRGSTAKESSADLVLAALGDKAVTGAVSNVKLAIRKNRAGRSGMEYPFSMREVALGADEDGDPITTLVVDWTPPSVTPEPAKPPPDPWKARTQPQQAIVDKLKRAMMGAMAERGVSLPIPPDGPVVRMIEQEKVREIFYSQTVAAGTPAQKAEIRRQQFRRALRWADENGAIAGHEIDAVDYLRLRRPGEGGEDESGDEDGED